MRPPLNWRGQTILDLARVLISLLDKNVSIKSTPVAGPMTPIREKGDWHLNPFWEKGDGSKYLGRRETAKKIREKGDGLYDKNGPIFKIWG